MRGLQSFRWPVKLAMLVIALLAVACILTLAWFAVRASRTGRSSFYTIAACAAGSLLVFQTSLNVFGSVDLLPLTGVTFPFVSNGGSAMLSAWGLLAYLKAMDTRADASFAIGRAAERKLDEEAARMAISSPLLETSIEGAKGVLINVTGSMDIGLEEVEQAASLVQQAVHPDALTIFGATFDETMDDEIRVTVIATGFDKNPADELPKIGTFAKPPVQLEGQEKDEQPKAPFAPIEPIAPAEEKPAEPEEDPFDDIFKIFNRRD